MACPPAAPELVLAGDLPAPAAGFPAGRLSEQVQWFGRRLKGRGLAVTTTGLQDALRSLACIGLVGKDDFKTALQANLVSRREDRPLFEEEFERFWILGERDGERPLHRQEIFRADGSGVEGESPQDGQAGQRVSGVLYSREERLGEKDFRDWEVSDWREASAWLDRWIHPFLGRLTRRYKTGRGPLLEIRKMLRRSLRFGGDVLDLTYRRKRPKPRRLIFLADVSGSMEPYGRFFFLFVQAWLQTPLPVEIFAFSTRLTRLTPWLRRRPREGIWEAIQQRVPQWSSGTRIGESLEIFIKEFGNKLLGRRSVLVIFSDGWDLGEAGRLRGALSRLRRRSHRLLWLNPLMGCPDYRPICQGMTTALPFIDRLLPVYDLKSFNALGESLGRELFPGSEKDEHRTSNVQHRI